VKLHTTALRYNRGARNSGPEKGGRVDLFDEEIIAAIEYMIEQVAQ